MPVSRVYHLCNILKPKWKSPFDFEDVRSLVLGSFNPYITSKVDNVDYFYGRKTNGFWKSIARVLDKPEDYYLGSVDKKYIVMEEYKFAFFDVINFLDISCDNEEVLKNYIDNEINKKFDDNKLFVARTKYNHNPVPIHLKRGYNYKILDFLKQNKVDFVIHTMGNSRISEDFTTNPRKGEFQDLILSIKELCIDKGSKFVEKSLSPSQKAINSGKTDKRELDMWIKKTILNL